MVHFNFGLGGSHNDDASATDNGNTPVATDQSVVQDQTVQNGTTDPAITLDASVPDMVAPVPVAETPVEPATETLPPQTAPEANFMPSFGDAAATPAEPDPMPAIADSVPEVAPAEPSPTPIFSNTAPTEVAQTTETSVEPAPMPAFGDMAAIPAEPVIDTPIEPVVDSMPVSAPDATAETNTAPEPSVDMTFAPLPAEPAPVAETPVEPTPSEITVGEETVPIFGSDDNNTINDTINTVTNDDMVFTPSFGDDTASDNAAAPIVSTNNQDPLQTLEQLKNDIQSFIDDKNNTIAGHRDHIGDLKAQIKDIEAEIKQEQKAIKDKKAEFGKMIAELQDLTGHFDEVKPKKSTKKAK